MPGPTVPTYGGPKVEPTELPNAKFQADPNLTAFGGGPTNEAVGNAAVGLEAEAHDIFQEQYKKANNAQYLAGSSRLSQMQSDLQTRVSQMRGQDSLQAMDYAEKTWGESVKSVMEAAPNDIVKNALNRDASVRFGHLYKFAQAHTSEQMQVYQDVQHKSLVENETNLAVQNATDNEAIQMSRDRVEAVTKDQAAIHGVAMDSPQFNAMLTNNLSPLHRDVILARVKSGDGDSAKEYLEEYRKEMTAPDVDRADGAVENAEKIRRGVDMYEKVRGMNLSNGEPDEARREAFVMSQPGTVKENMQAWEFVKARGNEAAVQMNKQQAANDHSFMNAAYKARSQNVPMADALKLVDSYATDAYDRATKQQAIQQIYAPPSQSDPKTFVDLWARIQDGNGSVSKADLDKAAFTDNTLNAADWRKLQEDLYKSKIEGADPLEKAQWERVKALADQKFGGQKVNREEFMYEMHVAAQGKSPEEIWKIAQDKLKGDPQTGFWGFAQTKQYKTDVQKHDANNLAIGKLQQDLGADVTNAIIAAGQRSNKNFGPADIDTFAKSLGGYDAIKPGTPVHNAMQSLIKHKERVTPGNIEDVLKAAPDGKY